jgi:DNA/RNA-binding domain of Phe-tRNA-synthetase-like protein
MEVKVNWSPEVSKRFPKLSLCIGSIKTVHVEKENEHIRKLEEAIEAEVRTKYDIETLKNNPTVRAYRDFYWKLGIDPTKTRPSGEALLRRVLHGDALPRICTLVDAYNLGSLKTVIPISGFDEDRLKPPFRIRFAKNGEAFTGIGMSEPVRLTDNMLVFADEIQVLCIYPYRDSDLTKITRRTQNVLIVGYGTPGISDLQLTQAVEVTLRHVKLVSGGEIEMVKVFSSALQ